MLAVRTAPWVPPYTLQAPHVLSVQKLGPVLCNSPEFIFVFALPDPDWALGGRETAFLIFVILPY